MAIPILMFGMVVNNRRMAFVILAATFIVVYFICERQIRRRINKTVIVALPVLLAYTVAGWSSRAPWASPIRSIRGSGYVLIPNEDAA